MSIRYGVWYNADMSTKPKSPTTQPTYTLQPKLVNGLFQVYIVELDLTVKTDTTDLNTALNQANNAILAHLEKEAQAAL